MPSVNPDDRDKFLAYAAKKLGEDKVIQANYMPKLQRLPVRSPMLTWAMTGGVPIGHMCRWYGPENSGKSMTNLGVIWAAQNFEQVVTEYYEAEIKFLQERKKKLAAKKRKNEMKELLARFPRGMETTLFDTEQRFDARLAESMGVDTKRITVIDTNIVEEVCDLLAESFLSTHINIIDSASNCHSIDEAGLEPGSQLRASAPRAWTAWLKQARKNMNKYENTLIIVDQMRTQLGKLNHKGQAIVEPPGVRYIKHNSSLTVEFDVGKRLYRDKKGLLTDDYEKADTSVKALGTDGKEPHGIQMSARIIKNSTGRPLRNARMRLSFPTYDPKTGEKLYDIGLDQEFELVESAIYFGIIEKDGSRFYPTDENFNRIPKDKKTDISWHGEPAAREAMRQDEELQRRVLRRLREDV